MPLHFEGLTTQRYVLTNAVKTRDSAIKETTLRVHITKVWVRHERGSLGPPMPPIAESLNVQYSQPSKRLRSPNLNRLGVVMVT